MSIRHQRYSLEARNCWNTVYSSGLSTDSLQGLPHSIHPVLVSLSFCYPIAVLYLLYFMFRIRVTLLFHSVSVAVRTMQDA